MASPTNNNANLVTSQITYESSAGSWTELAPVSRSREYLMILNNSGDDVWVNTNSVPTTTTSITLKTGNGLEFRLAPINAVSVLGKGASGTLEMVEG